MKVFKKLTMSVLTAAMVVGMACSAFAANSPTKTPTKPTTTPTKTPVVVNRTTTTSTGAGAGGYVIEPLGTNSKRSDSWTDHVPAADQAAIQAGSVDDFIANLGSSSTPGKDTVISAAQGMQYLCTWFDCYPYGTAAKTNATVSMIVPGIGKYAASDVAVLHFSETRGVFETLNFSMDGGDQISVKFADFSPTAIVVRDSNPVTPVKATTASAPKTGVASTWAVYAVVAMVLAAAAVLVYRKKRA